jgi:hypothetical protein
MTVGIRYARSWSLINDFISGFHCRNSFNEFKIEFDDLSGISIVYVFNDRCVMNRWSSKFSFLLLSMAVLDFFGSKLLIAFPKSDFAQLSSGQ